jgi:hypothetical protein
MDLVTEKYERDLLYKSKESLVVVLQSIIRGFLLRKWLDERQKFFINHSADLIKIQVILLE